MISREEFLAQCQTLGLGEVEHEIAKWVRRFDSPELAKRRLSENSLLRLGLDYATLDPSSPFQLDGVDDLPATLLARALGNSARPRSRSARTFFLLSAASYAVAGNFASASVWAQKIKNAQSSGPFEAWITEVLSSCLRYFPTKPSPELLEYSRILDLALSTGRERDFIKATNAFDVLCQGNSRHWPDLDRYLLLHWRAIHTRCHQLSAARILTKNGFKNRGYISALRRNTSALLFPSQAHALEKHELLTHSTNALILLPTSTGKSLLGELAIINALSDEKPLGVYLAPYRALADQVARRMKRRLKQIGIKCEVRRGGYLDDKEFSTGPEQRVLVATPEAFDWLLRTQPSLYTQIACCVMDEFHLVEQAGRGLVYEGIVARLTGFSRTDPIRLIALSPVLSHSLELSAWLKIPDGGTISSGWRPTGRRVAIATSNQTMKYYTPGERLSQRVTENEVPSWEGEIDLPHRIDSLAPPPRYALAEEQRKQVLARIGHTGHGRRKDASA